jgi:putative hydrolase of the HAD superfamily
MLPPGFDASSRPSMTKLSLLLWDVGGVLLTNAWDIPDRRLAARQFGLDAGEFERRHQKVVADFEKGRIDEEEYLSRTVFYTSRPFSRAAFQQFMRGRSRPHPAALDTARALRAQGEYVMATLNNESRALNEYRITSFRLPEIFHAFFSSCYTGHRKPEPEAYRYAVEITQRRPEESLFLDDRLDNVKAAATLGLRTLWVRDPERLRDDLVAAGVTIG